MRKLLTPIIYVVILFPMTAIVVGIEMNLRSLGILGAWEGVIDLPSFIMFLSTIIVFGVPIFWLANLLLKRLEKVHTPKIYDHLRQSLFYYLIAGYCLFTWAAGGFGNNEEDAYMLLWMGISFIGILVNYKFLFRGHNASEA